MSYFIGIAIVAGIVFFFINVIAMASDMDGWVTFWQRIIVFFFCRGSQLLPKHIIPYSRKVKDKEAKRLIAQTLKQVKAGDNYWWYYEQERQKKYASMLNIAS